MMPCHDDYAAIRHTTADFIDTDYAIDYLPMVFIITLPLAARLHTFATRL